MSAEDEMLPPVSPELLRAIAALNRQYAEAIARKLDREICEAAGVDPDSIP